jgi:hypothetical protein
LRLTAAVYLQRLSNFFLCEIFRRRSCRACRAAASCQPEDERAKRIHCACSEVFGCEAFKLNKLSPGPVADHEFLNLVITDPQGLDPRSRMLHPTLVKPIDLGGMSVLRAGATNAEFEETFAEMKKGSDARGRPRYFHGVCVFPVGSVRKNGNSRSMGVYDTALPGRPHHADVLAPPVDRKAQEARKKRLIDQIGRSFVDVSQFREGAFQHLAREASPAT